MLFNDDCVKIMATLPKNSIDMVFADPPYYLSNGGLTIKSGKVVSVDKGNWDKSSSVKDPKAFTKEWIGLCHDILKPEGTIWVSGTHHNLEMVETALKSCGFHFINSVIWHKQDPPPLVYKTRFRFSYETILWYGKGNHHYFDYESMYSLCNSEMEDVWTIPAVGMGEKLFGYHPTQKPEALLKQIIIASTRKGDLVLDPFMGSGTTCAVAKSLGRRYVGIEKEKMYFTIAKRRVDAIGRN